MDCKQVEDLLSEYIEHELPPEVHKEVSKHLEKCLPCHVLKDQVEELMSAFPELEEEVPFFLKNRLYYIPEAEQDNVIDLEVKWSYLKWVAAVIGTFVLFLNLFYFTNIYPSANRVLHSVVSGIETLAVKTEAVYERVKDSNLLFFLPSGEKEMERTDKTDKKNPDQTKNIDNSMEKNNERNGGNDV